MAMIRCSPGKIIIILSHYRQGAAGLATSLSFKVIPGEKHSMSDEESATHTDGSMIGQRLTRRRTRARSGGLKWNTNGVKLLLRFMPYLLPMIIESLRIIRFILGLRRGGF